MCLWVLLATGVSVSTLIPFPSPEKQRTVTSRKTGTCWAVPFCCKCEARGMNPLVSQFP